MLPALYFSHFETEALMKTRAALSVAYGQPLLVDEIDLADPGPEHVLVKQFASGICHSQLHGLHNPSSPRPSVPGHESTGLAVRAGANVTHVKEGDHVMLTWLPRAPFEGMARFMVTGLSYKGQEIELNNGLAPTFTWAEHRLAHQQYVVPMDKDVDPLLTSILDQVHDVVDMRVEESLAIRGARGRRGQ